MMYLSRRNCLTLDDRQRLAKFIKFVELVKGEGRQKESTQIWVKFEWN